MSDDNNYGAFIPTTNIWDVSEIYSTEVTSPEFKELLVRLYQNLNNMALALNIKDSAYYDTSEFVNGQAFFPDPALDSSTAATPVMRQVFRKVINFGALPNTTTKNVAHALSPTTGWTFTRIYGCASNTTSLTYMPLPNTSAGLFVDATNVSVVAASNLSAYNVTYIVIEYIKT